MSIYKANRPLYAILLLILLLALSSCARIAKRDFASQYEKWLSADTVALLTIDNVQQSRQRWSETAAGKGWSDPAAEYWRSQQFSPAVQRLADQAGASGITQLLDMVQGRVVVALYLPEKQAGLAPNAIVFAAMDFGGNKDAAQKFINEKWQKMQEIPVGKASIAIHSARYLNNGALCSVWKGSDLLLSTSPEELQNILTNSQEKSLRSNPAWKAARDNKSPSDDLFMFVNSGRIYDTMLPMLKNAFILKGIPEQAPRLQALLQMLGLDSMDTISFASRMQGKAFLSKTVLTSRGNRTGLLFPPLVSGDLETPKWITTEVEDFMAMRIKPPVQAKDALVNALSELHPMVRQRLNELGQSFTDATGLAVDSLLAPFGSEMALFSGKQKSGILPDLVLLIEARDYKAIEENFAALEKTTKGKVSRKAADGYTYEERYFPPSPVPIYTARIGDFLMVSTKNNWIRNFGKQRRALEESRQKPDPRLPAGPDSLLPLLDKPFQPVPKGMGVVARSYSNPLAQIANLESQLPMFKMLFNARLKDALGVEIPDWMISAMPPMSAFARESFPMVERTSQDKSKIVKEVYSPMDPLATPLTAAGVVMAGQLLAKPGE